MENLHQPSNISYGVGELAELRDLIISLSKGIRASRQYPVEHPIALQFKQAFRTQLARYFEHSDRLALRTSIDQLEASDEVIYRAPINSDNIAHLLHRDGVRSFEIFPSVSPQEIDSLFDAFVACSRQDDERHDIVNCFWRAGFENIKYEVADSFESGEVGELLDSFSGEEAATKSGGTNISFSPGSNISWPTSGETLQKQAEDYNSFMHRSFADPDKFKESEEAALAEMIRDDRAKDTKREVVDLLLQLCAENTGPQDMRITLESLQSTYDRLITDGDFDTLNNILASIRRLLKADQFESQVVKKRLKEFESRCGDGVRIKLITGALNKDSEIQLAGVERYLNELGWESLTNLLWMLGELAHYPARKMVCDLLVKKGFEKIDLLGAAVFDSRWYVARNVVWVLGEMKTLQSLSYLSKAAKHAEPRVKTEVIKALGKLGGDKSAGVLLSMLNDESEKICSLAARELGINQSNTAFQGLVDIAKDKDFPDAPPPHVRQILDALVLCGGDKAVAFCEDILSKSTKFNKARLQRFQEVTINALAQSDSAQAANLLSRLCIDSRAHIATTAKRVHSLMKNRREVK